MFLMPPSSNDFKFLYNLRNAPSTREMMIDSKPFEYEDHEKWLEKKLLQDGYYIYIGLKNYYRVGYIRVHWVDDAYDLSYVVAEEFRGNGYAREMIDEISKLFLPLEALIKKTNIPSIKTVEALGFTMEQELNNLKVYRLNDRATT